MRFLLISVSGVGLALTVIPSFFVLYGMITWAWHANLMMVGMTLWFATAPFWMRED
jgi:hypothetical protein